MRSGTSAILVLSLLLVPLCWVSSVRAASTADAAGDHWRTGVAELEDLDDEAVRLAPRLRVMLGGYVKTDFIHDLDQALGDVFDVDGIAVGSGGGGDRFRVHVRESRLTFGAAIDTGRGPVRALLEADLFHEDSHAPRLRHALVEWRGLIVGQYWSNFMPLEVHPSTVDTEGPAGISFLRQVQVRYTHPLGDDVEVSAALETSGFSGRVGDDVVVPETTRGILAGIDAMPDATLAATWAQDWGHVRLAGVGRLLDPAASDDRAFAWGLSLAGRAQAWQGGRVLGALTGGDGIGRYIINGEGRDAFVDERGDLRTIGSWGAVAGVAQEFSEQVTGRVVGGFYRVEDTFAPSDTRTLQTLHTSLFWRPADRITIGTEVVLGRRETAGGRSGSNTRLQGALQVDF